MAQADSSIVSKLRKAILNICNYPRGCRRFSDIIGSIPITHELEEGKKLCETVRSIHDERIFNSFNKYFDNEEPFQLEDVLISGSYSEGVYKVNLQTNSTSDIDFMLILKNIKVTEEDQKSGNLTVKEDTPFVNLYLTDEDLIEKWADFLEASSHTRCEKSIRLSPMKLKKRLREEYINYGPIYTQLVKENVEKVDEGPSVAVCSKLPGKAEVTNQSHTGHLPVEDYDFVLAIKCDGWPLCAQEWPSRSRCWPSQDVVQNIIEGGFHIVCKSSLEGDFRLSYSNAETLLIKNVNDLQHKTYRAFKSFVSHYKNEWSSNVKKIFCSYHLKTIFLWYCEKSDPGDWTEERVDVHLLSLIDDLTLALKEGNLPMYFMPHYNLMGNMEDSSEVVGKIAELRFNYNLIGEAIISEEPSILEWVNVIFNSRFPGLCQLYEKGFKEGNFDPKDFLRYVQTWEDGYDKFWINSTGGIPAERSDLHGEGAADILREQITKYVNKYCESMNNDCVNKPLKEDDENLD